MAKYKVKNLSYEETRSVRIFSVNADAVTTAPSDFTPLDPFGLSFGVGLAPAPEPIVISCADVPNETQQTQLVGLFQVVVDDVVQTDGGRHYTAEELQTYYTENNIEITDGETLEDGWYWTQDEITAYFNANQEDLGVTVDQHYVISCAGAPTKTECLLVDGEWDVYVDNRLVAENVTIATVIDTLSTGEVIAEECPRPVVPTASATSQFITDYDGRYNVVINGTPYSNISQNEMIELLNSEGVEIRLFGDYQPQ